VSPADVLLELNRALTFESTANDLTGPVVLTKAEYRERQRFSARRTVWAETVEVFVFVQFDSQHFFKVINLFLCGDEICNKNKRLIENNELITI